MRFQVIKKSKPSRIRVFHGLVNYGTQAGLFAKCLRDNGVDAISATYPDPYKRLVDIELPEGNSFFGKKYHNARNWLRRAYWFYRYNVFHFYFGTSLFPRQKDLPLYKIFGKKVLMEYLGYDVQLYDYSVKKYSVTNIKYYYPERKSLEDDRRKIARLKTETRHVDKQLVCAPYLCEFVPNASVLPLGIDLRDYEYSPMQLSGNEVVIMHAPSSRLNKGTDVIVESIERLKREGYCIRFILLENVTHLELKSKYQKCHIFIDQILAGWYGTAAIEAMAIGRPTLCFLRESYFEHIDYGPSIPIINAQPATIYQVLKETLEKKDMLPQIGRQSRGFVEKIHDINKITVRLIEIYKTL